MALLEQRAMVWHGWAVVVPSLMVALGLGAAVLVPITAIPEPVNA